MIAASKAQQTSGRVPIHPALPLIGGGMNLEDAIQSYVSKVSEVETRSSRGECCYQELELSRLDLADALIEELDLPIPRDPFELMRKYQEKRDALRRSPHGNLRQSIMERDNFRCVLCGETKQIAVDHIIPYSKGGLTIYENLQLLCKSCNSQKGARL